MTPQTQPPLSRPDLYTLGQPRARGQQLRADQAAAPALLPVLRRPQGAPPPGRTLLARRRRPASELGDGTLEAQTVLRGGRRGRHNPRLPAFADRRAGVLEGARAERPERRGEPLQGPVFERGVRLSGTSNELEEWVYNTRDFLAGRAADALLGLGEEAAKGGDFEGAARHAQAAHVHVVVLEPEQLGRAYTPLSGERSPLGG